jgi:hypothetical protein
MNLELAFGLWPIDSPIKKVGKCPRGARDKWGKEWGRDEGMNRKLDLVWHFPALFVEPDSWLGWQL